MPEYYFQIKGRKHPRCKCRDIKKIIQNGREIDLDADIMGWGISNWQWPPLFSGKVEAVDRKEAKIKVNDLYSVQFPVRVLKKDLESHEFLLHLQELRPLPYDGYLHSIFEERKCAREECKNTFKVIDKYNLDSYCDGGSSYCSKLCDKLDAQKREQYKVEHYMEDNHAPVIYKITNKNNLNKCYIGQTTQAFTLRWYQHFFQPSDTLFHKEIKGSNVTDWIFEIVEIINVPNNMDNKERKKHIDDREKYYIELYKAKEEGYNSK
jgi:hypothetical protein